MGNGSDATGEQQFHLGSLQAHTSCGKFKDKNRLLYRIIAKTAPVKMGSYNVTMLSGVVKVTE